jgi:hypothetical protein
VDYLLEVVGRRELEAQTAAGREVMATRMVRMAEEAAAEALVILAEAAELLLAQPMARPAEDWIIGIWNLEFRIWNIWINKK